MSKKTAQEMAEWMAQLADDFNSKWIGTYILDENHQPVKASTLTWARCLEMSDRQVALSETELHEVSTVFLGLDHSFGNGPPILFETMVFARERGGDGQRLGDDLGLMDRYATWDEALKGHNDILREVSKLEGEATKKVKSLQTPPERNKA